jgi:hypothetical protein
MVGIFFAMGTVHLDRSREDAWPIEYNAGNNGVVVCQLCFSFLDGSIRRKFPVAPRLKSTEEGLGYNEMTLTRFGWVLKHLAPRRA